MEPPKVKRTMMAQQALEVSDLLNMRFSGMPVGQEPKKRLLVNAPDGPSTDGGKKARQSITIGPADATSAAALMCGWIDVAHKKAELRSYRVVAAQSEQRYHKAFDVTQAEYEGLIREAQSLLGFQGFEIVVHDEMPAQTSSPGHAGAVVQGGQPEASSNMPMILSLTVLVVGVIAAVVGFLATR